MAPKRKARKAKPKRKTKITRTRPIRPHALFVRLFDTERDAIRKAAGRKPLATFVREAALAYVTGERIETRKR